MAQILEQADKSLILELSAEERATFNFTQGQLAAYITLWLDERFKSMWKDIVDKFTVKQKQDLYTMLSKDIEAIPAPAEPVEDKA
jgi:hypothetical protein